MNPAINKDLDRQHLAHDTANNIKSLQETVRNVSKLHEELLEVNLSIGVYIKESKELLEALRLESASKAKSSFDVVDILSKSSSSSEEQLASPLKPDNSPIIKGAFRKRPGLRSSSKSPQWETGCRSNEGSLDGSPDRKRLKTNVNHSPANQQVEDGFRLAEKSSEVSFREDGVPCKIRRKCLSVTPPNKELGQGDCLPSTSGTDSMSDISHSLLYAQLPRRVVECNGYIEFTRTRSGQSTHSMKWDRKCKLQVLYSEDPLNVGEYVIWAIYYSDDSKCRRNLLSAFEELAC